MVQVSITSRDNVFQLFVGKELKSSTSIRERKREREYLEATNGNVFAYLTFLGQLASFLGIPL